MQGRLSPPVKGAIQEFPSNWRQEFINLKGTGLNHIDWIVTKKSFKNNPLFNTDLSLLPIRSVCADNMIDTQIYKSSFLKENLEPICKAAVKNKIYSITIPLLEDSSIHDPSIREKFIDAIKPYAKKYNNLIFSFEFECEPEDILEVVKVGKNFRITYDTGNITSYTKNRASYHEFINKLIHRIDCVHLKDRTLEGQTVRLGTGDTQINNIIMLLRWLEYEGDYTMQLAREKTGNELNTSLKHAQFFKRFFLRNTPH